VVLLLSVAAPSRAQEAISEEGPPPASVEQSVSSIERSYERPARLLLEHARFFPWLKEQLKDAPPFFRDMRLDINLRTFYLNNGNLNGTRNEAWAGGGSLAYQSGWLLDRLSVGAVLYTSQPLYAPSDRDGTLLLEQGQNGYTVLGQLYARVKLLDELFLNLYRYTYDTPYLGEHDNRMTPNTFEGYTFQGRLGGADGGPGLRYGGGYITKIKQRDDDEFIWMSRAAGASVDRGVGIAGALFSYRGFSAGGIDYYSADIINIAYGETKYAATLPGGVGILFAAQYTDQRSVGGELLTGSSFSTNQFGVKAGVSYANAVLSLAYTRDAKGANLQNPWSGTPGYTSAIVQNFNSAGEQAFLVKGSFDFSKLGLTGLTAYALYDHGWGKVSPSTKAAQPNVNEIDVDVQWRPEWSVLKGLWFRARYAHVDQYESPRNSTNTYQIIVNYSFTPY
jgi:hypothetical protein